MSDSLSIFKEAFLARLAPVFHEVTLPALLKFQPEHYPLNAVIAALGAFLTSALLFMVGAWLRRWPERVSTDEQQARIEAMRTTARHWLPWLLILSPTPIGAIIIVFAGFFRIGAVTTALAIVAAEVLWRLSPVL